MLQTVNTSGHGSWPSAILNPVSEPETWKRDIRSKREVEVRPPSVSDVALLYPEAVVASSDAFAWQDIRVIHLRHSLNEMVVPRFRQSLPDVEPERPSSSARPSWQR